MLIPDLTFLLSFWSEGTIIFSFWGLLSWDAIPSKSNGRPFYKIWTEIGLHFRTFHFHWIIIHCERRWFCNSEWGGPIGTVLTVGHCDSQRSTKAWSAQSRLKTIIWRCVGGLACFIPGFIQNKKCLISLLF